MYGVEYAIAKFKSQLVAVVIERHFARTLRGNSSPVTTQATGPHELARLTEEDVNAHKGNSGLLGWQICCASYSSSDGDDELANAHANSAHEQQIAATHLLN